MVPRGRRLEGGGGGEACAVDAAARVGRRVCVGGGQLDHVARAHVQRPARLAEEVWVVARVLRVRRVEGEHHARDHHHDHHERPALVWRARGMGEGGRGHGESSRRQGCECVAGTRGRIRGGGGAVLARRRLVSCGACSKSVLCTMVVTFSRNVGGSSSSSSSASASSGDPFRAHGGGAAAGSSGSSSSSPWPGLSPLPPARGRRPGAAAAATAARGRPLSM